MSENENARPVISGGSPPRTNVIRSAPDVELRDTESSRLPELAGHFAVFDEWTEIDSWEGRFLEKIERGAMKKTIRENRDSMRVLFQHGRDPSIGEKILGPIVSLDEDERGVAYRVEFMDTAYNRELEPGLRRGLYGSSFRFEVVKEDFDPRPERSEHNPDGIPERVIREAKVFEFGPVAFPAYAGATAAVRSLSYADLEEGARVRHELHSGIHVITTTNTTNTTPAAVSVTIAETKDEPAHSERAVSLDAETTNNEGAEMVKGTIEEMRSRQTEIKVALEEIDSESSGSLTAERQEEWNTLVEENGELERNIADKLDRGKVLTQTSSIPDAIEPPERPKVPGPGNRSKVPDDIYDVAEYRNRAFDSHQLRRLYADGARRAIEIAQFPHPEADRAKCAEHVTKLIEREELNADGESELAKRILVTGSPLYRRAFGKQVTGQLLSPDEQRALSLTTTAGGFAVPIQIDPTVIPTSNGVVNPLRAIARVEQMTSAEWRGVTSAGVTAGYAAEASEAGDDAPVLVQPVAYAERADVFIPFSFEIGQDWGSLESEMAALIVDSKDALEASKFITGLGHSSTEPEGLLVGGTAIVSTAAATTFAVGDLYSLEEGLPPRFRPRARFIGNKKQFNRVRQFDTAGGAALWERLGAGTPPELIGYPAHEESEMVSTITSASSILTFGDFSHFLIADRMGMSVELVPHLLHTANNRPSGQRGLFAFWRNTSKVLAWQAFRTLKVT